MANILVVTGSVRPGSVNQEVVPLVVSEVEAQGSKATVADLGQLNMPFIDSELIPSMPDFTPPHESVKAWTDMVASADGVVFVTPEYNHNLSPVQLNAIDWIYKEWRGKPVALVGYGMRSGATQAHEVAREALASNLKADVGVMQANIFLGRELGLDGSILDEKAVNGKISASISELLEKTASEK